MKTRTQTRTALSQKGPLLLSASPKIIDFNVYICYTQSHLQRNGLIASTLTNIKAADLVPSGTAVASSQVSHQAIMSFATILFGIQHRQTEITRQGYAMHGVALKQLNQVLLSDTTQHSRDEAIVAVAALSISELLVPSGPRNYLTHMMGLEKLVDLQDPVAFWSENSSGFCKGVRFMILLASLKLGKPSILAKTDWKTVMRLNSSYEELQEQEVFDVLADCSVLLAERDAILLAWNVNSTNAPDQRNDIERQARSLLIHLYEWRRRWHTDIENTRHETAVSLSRREKPQFIHIEDTEVTFITASTIPNVPAAVMLMLYNLALMRVLQIIPSLPLEKSATQNTSQQHETCNECRVNERIAAREACRCIQYYLCIKRRLDPSTPPIVHWAVAAVWTALRHDDSIEGIWMQDLMSKKGRQMAAEGQRSTYLWLNSLPE
jgi:hypothetical protein